MTISTCKPDLEATQPTKTMTAHPPNEAVCIHIFIASLCLSYLPTMLSSIDNDATIEALTTPKFEGFISMQLLGLIRLAFATMMFAITFQRILFGKGCGVTTPYSKQTKLKAKFISLDGIRSQGMFTSWCWNALSLSFAINGTLTLHSASSSLPFEEQHYSKHLLRIALLLHEISVPLSMLVSFCVKYVLWPNAIRKGTTTEPFTNLRSLLQHNANVIASLLEVCILGRIPIRSMDVFIVPMYGLLYILYTWFMTHKWLTSSEPQFVYFFLDTTLPPKTVVSVMVCLLVALIVFFGFATSLDGTILSYYNDGNDIVWNGFCVIMIASCFCRFRD